MKISGIDKDLEDLIYYLDANGFKPFASCDGVIANHENPQEVGNAYISFLKSQRILDIMAAFLNKSDEFVVALEGENHLEPHELYGNLISGIAYHVSFENKRGERTLEFMDTIKDVVEGRRVVSEKEKRDLEMLERPLMNNVNSNVAFEVIFKNNYQPYMCKAGKINELCIKTVIGEERIEGNISITPQRDMEVLAQLVAKQYGIPQKRESFDEEYTEDEFIIASNDRCMCSIYFTDEHFLQILEQIRYIREIAHTLPTFEAREWIGSDEEFYEDYYGLQEREERLQELEQEAERILQEERRIQELEGQNIGE